ncbi:hypothetical protein PENTCL1PPCAC_24250, partial [Pristionchus entomophagus]
DPTIFSSPTRMSNVILKIGDQQLHVSKEYLAVHSPVFEAMFFGNFEENGRKEVVIKDVVYEEFLDLLHLIYFKSLVITDRIVVHILKLADRFQMEDVMELTKKHLIQSKGINAAKKLLIADQYRLDSVRDHCLQSFTSFVNLMKELKLTPECDNLSKDMKSAIYDRFSKI